MMMNLGAPEMFMLGILALLLFGPRKLPELGKALGEGLAAFRESSRQLSSEFRRQLEDEANPPSPPPTIPGEVLTGTSGLSATPLASPMPMPMPTPATAAVAESGESVEVIEPAGEAPVPTPA